MDHQKRLLQQILIIIFAYLGYSSLVYSDENELMALSVEDLLNVEVVSVAKKAKSLNNSPAAIYVITQDDIRRIGATSIPEALRLAPGIEVARINANKWAVTARGFNGSFANKLLVLIDGRSAYTRTFSGVYWENQDVMLEDVERIEVIRGPGATLWGANAMNGVINIITRHSADTQGGLLVAGAGSEEQGFGAFRYGGKLNDKSTARAYLKGFKRDENTQQSGGGANDGWNKVQAGFRMDSQPTSRDNLSIQGGGYHSLINRSATLSQTSPPYQSILDDRIKAYGGNILVKHQHTFSSTSNYSLQIYYDFYRRADSFYDEGRHVVDIDFQHRFAFLDWNDVLWGIKYRYSRDDTSIASANNINKFEPKKRNDQLVSAFIQDEITLLEDTLWLTLGSKFEFNDYSGFEAQPTARFLWVPHHQHRLWGAVSRAVRTPSRSEHDITLLADVIPPQPPAIPAPLALIFEGNPQFDSEQVISYELGYRTTIIDNMSIDFTAFYNDYSHLRTAQIDIPFFDLATGSIVLANTLVNDGKAQTYGFEISTVWQMLDWWRWDANYSLLKTVLNQQATLTTAISPQQRVSLRSSLSPWQDIDLDVLFRYVDSNTIIRFSGANVIDAYVSMDMRLAWRPVDGVELSLVGQNLLANHHLEYIQETFTTATEIDRGVYGKLTWRF